MTEGADRADARSAPSVIRPLSASRILAAFLCGLPGDYAVALRASDKLARLSAQPQRDRPADRGLLQRLAVDLQDIAGDRRPAEPLGALGRRRTGRRA